MSDHTVTQEVFELVLVRPVLVRGGEHPTLVELWWRAPQQGDRLAQVYVDERLATISTDPEQRSVWLHLDRGQAGGRRIELLAVPTGSALAWMSHRDALSGWPAATRGGQSLAVERDESLPLNAQVIFELDGQRRGEQPLWPGDAHRGGFGAVFGHGGFGQDAAAGPGLGEGELGVGPLGADGETSRFNVRLNPGTHELSANIKTDLGSVTVEPKTSNVAAIPGPAAQLSIDSDFTLRWQAAGDTEDV